MNHLDVFTIDTVLDLYDDYLADCSITEGACCAGQMSPASFINLNLIQEGKDPLDDRLLLKIIDTYESNPSATNGEILNTLAR